MTANSTQNRGDISHIVDATVAGINSSVLYRNNCAKTIVNRENATSGNIISVFIIELILCCILKTNGIIIKRNIAHTVFLTITTSSGNICDRYFLKMFVAVARENALIMINRSQWFKVIHENCHFVIIKNIPKNINIHQSIWFLDTFSDSHRNAIIPANTGSNLHIITEFVAVVISNHFNKNNGATIAESIAVISNRKRSFFGSLCIFLISGINQKNRNNVITASVCAIAASVSGTRFSNKIFPNIEYVDKKNIEITHVMMPL